MDKGSGRESSINGSVEASTRSEAKGLGVVRYSVTFVLCNSRCRLKFMFLDCICMMRLDVLVIMALGQLYPCMDPASVPLLDRTCTSCCPMAMYRDIDEEKAYIAFVFACG